MKYLVIVQSGKGEKNAIIFDTLNDAKNYLKEFEAALDHPMRTSWENEECLAVKMANNDWIRVYVLEVERAEYRLVQHTRGEKDVERRFSTRNSAVKYVNQNIKASLYDNSCGDWVDGTNNRYYKLYSVVLESENSSRKVLERFSAADSLSLVNNDTDIIDEEDIDYEYHHEDIITKEQSHAFSPKHIFTAIMQNNRKKVCFAILALVIGIVGIKLLATDWQLVADERKANQFSVSEEIKSIADSIYLTRKGKAAFFASQPKLLGSIDFNKTCGRDGSGTFTSGCYYEDSQDNEHIEIYNVGASTIKENGITYNFAEYRKSVTLHEALHAIWERQSDDTKTSVCSDLKILSNQISTLKQEVSLYKSSELCTELFARVGSEYAPILSPNNTIPSSSYVPIKYSSLDANGKDAISNLIKIYNRYFDTTKFDWVLVYWENEKQLDAFETKILTYATNLNNREQYTQSLINQYYRWPTWARYNAANSAISEYNAMVSTYNSYIDTYNKIYTKLDSEQTMRTGGFLNL